MAKNYTSLDHLVNKKQEKYISKPKEVEPIPSTKEKYEIKEAVEHKVEEEIKPYVSPRSETIEIPPDLKKLGLQQTTTTQFPTYQNIKLPISDDKVLTGLNAPVTSSFRWLATLALYLLQKAHLTLRLVHGKVVRILRS